MRSSFSYLLALWSVICVTFPATSSAEDWERVRTWEGTLTLPAYPWYDDVNPTFEELGGKIYYPYTRQDHIAKTKSERTYRALFLENEYLKVTCFPELGGRIHSVLDKTTNEEMFHKNDEIKPALIAMRGAWISGGIEWNVGPQGHTVTVVSPVDALIVENEDGSATLVVGNTEKMFRTRWTARLTLHPGKAYLDEEIRLFNPTDGVHPFYFWNCTAFPNLPGTRFIYPMTLGTDHYGETFFAWPIHEGRDLSWLKNFPGATSVFAYECIFDFFGSYDVDLDRGLVSYANHHVVKGKKAWTWGKDDFGVVSEMALSDAGPVHAQYIEVQSGPLLTQSDYGMLEPRQEMAWREFWYPVHGLGEGFEYATRDVAIQRSSNRDGGLELCLIATGRFPNSECVLSRGETVLLKQRLDLSPLRATRVSLPSPPRGPIGVTVRSQDGEILLSYETPLAIPKVDPPDLTKRTARTDGQPTADELYQTAYTADSRSDPQGARKGYEAVLEVDPMHVASLIALAELDIEFGNFTDAAERTRTALEREPGNGMASYLLGVARLHQGKLQEALTCGYKAAHTLDAMALGYNLVGRARARVNDYAAAVAAFARARKKDPEDTQNRDYWLAARYAGGDTAGVVRDAASIVEKEDPTDFIPRALAGLHSDDAMDKFVRDVKTIVGEKEFTMLEVATFLAGMGLYEEASRILEVLCVESGLGATSLPYYYLAYYSHKLGDEAAAGDYLKRAGAMSTDYVFPSRVEAREVLRYAVAAAPADAHAHLLLGHISAGLRHLDEAVSHWEKAVELNPDLSVAWRLLGLYAQTKQNDFEKAEICFRKAIAARPDDQVLYHDLATVMTVLDRCPEAIRFVEQMPRKATPRYDVLLWLANAYVAEERYDECIELLETARFSNWEGSTEPRDIFVSALMVRGKIRYEAKLYEQALENFQRALTYPENLEVGAIAEPTDAETRYWLGKTFMMLGRNDEARAAWEEGAKQVVEPLATLRFLQVTPTHVEHVKRCAMALELLDVTR